jgi:demethylmenaquinone methyltransferase/2-methoxy-6-polyprenyl-1,4-benzoquinol methylase
MSEKVREMFAAIAPKYDFMNNLLSLGIHHRWRRKAVRLSGAKSGDKVLDCATGTGDLAIEFQKAVGRGGEVTGTDFCEDMVVLAREKSNKSGLPIKFQVEDAMALSFADNIFDYSSISFGIRNVDVPQQGVSEMARVVKPGGKVIIIEFGQPRGFFKIVYDIYSKFFMPILGKIFAGDVEAYTYLPQTASRFPCREDFTEIMKATGSFSECRYYTLSGGIAFIYIGIVK